MYFKIPFDKYGSRTTISLSNVKCIHVAKMDEPYVDHDCIQIIYEDMTNITIFAKSELFSRMVVELYDLITAQLPS